jgi:hypothetical protein
MYSISSRRRAASFLDAVAPSTKQERKRSESVIGSGLFLLLKVKTLLEYQSDKDLQTLYTKPVPVYGT